MANVKLNVNARLQKAIDENVSVTSLKSGSQSLVYSGGRIQIATPSGKLTVAGKAYYKKIGQTPPNGAYDLENPLN